MITDSIFSLAFLAIMFVLFVLEATTHSYSFNHRNVDVWLIYAVWDGLPSHWLCLWQSICLSLPYLPANVTNTGDHFKMKII